MKIELTNQIALVTGANAGIGLKIAETLAASGAKVALNCFNNRSGADQAAEEIRSQGGEAEVFQADMSNVSQVEAMVKSIEAKFGGTIDILINNAGGLVKRVPNVEMNEEHYQKVMDINFKTCVFTCKAVASGMISKGRGKIVNIASIASHDGGGPGGSVYAASKAAVSAYSKGLAKELAQHGIGVNLISPGFIGQTPFHDTFTTDAGRQGAIGRIPLGREGVPQDVANAVLFLVSDLAGYLTGETIEVNGGMFMR